MSIRASYGLFYDTPQLFFYTRFANNPPWGAQISLTNPRGGLSNPYLDYPGGNPFPALNAVSKDMQFPSGGVYVNAPLDMRPSYLQQWNLSVQRQDGAWLISGTYIGNKATHFWAATELNPAIFGPGAALANTQARRAFNALNPAAGPAYSTMGQVDDGGVSAYSGLLLTAQKRLSHNVSVLANWTWSHCLSDPETTEITGPTYINPRNRSADRSNCSSDRRHVFNLSPVVSTPQFSNRAARVLGTGWQWSTILRAQTGGYATITTGADNAFSGIGGQRATQALAKVYDANPSVDHYLNRNAFGTPGSGTLSPMRPLIVQNIGIFTLDMSLSRSFRIRESQTIQLRGEAFNLPNHLNPNAPTTGLNSTNFGRITSAADPRLMQFALKYLF